MNNESLTITLRIALVMGVVLFLPILAMPGIIDRVDDLLYGRDAGQWMDVGLARKPPAIEPHEFLPGPWQHGTARLTDGVSREGTSGPAPAARHVAPPVPAPGPIGYDNSPTATEVRATPDVFSASTPLPVSHNFSSDGLAERSAYASAAMADSASDPNLRQPVLTAEQELRIQSLSEQLRGQGAAYMLLERVVEGESWYRFHCRMELPGNPSYSQPFEAMAAHPLDAVQIVSRAVHDWRREQSGVREMGTVGIDESW